MPLYSLSLVYRYVTLIYYCINLQMELMMFFNFCVTQATELRSWMYYGYMTVACFAEQCVHFPDVVLHI